MKKIGVDARLYNQTGVGTYLQNFLFYLDKKNDKRFIYYIYLLKKDFDKVTFKSKNIYKKETNFYWHTFSEQIGFLWTLLKDNLDLVHFTYFSFPILYPKKYILTIHDLTPILFKTGRASIKNPLIYYFKYFIFKKIFSISVKKAKKIITPSKTVKKQLIEYFGDEIGKKIVPIYEGIGYQLVKTPKNNYSNKLFAKNFKNFFLYVGNFYPHKNVENLILAFRKLVGHYQLILIGPDDFFARRLENMLKNLNAKNIIILKNLQKKELIWFYKNCLALVHPSLSEGFGLTLIEAAYFGKPIIASNIDVFQELWEKNYLAFDPKNVDDIKAKLKFFLEKRPHFFYKDLLKKYSFEKMTKETLKIYKQSLNDIE